LAELVPGEAAKTCSDDPRAEPGTAATVSWPVARSVSLTVTGIVRAAGGGRRGVAAARKHAASREESDEQETPEDHPAERQPAGGRPRRRRDEPSTRGVDGGRGTNGAARAIENRFYAG